MPRLTLSIALALTACLALGACGVDGAPQPPVKPGITVTGDAQFGIVSR
ncbi:MAG: hypothetical protein NTW20_05465 [Rhodobacterales bacterium]|nr:hypothetical protein [Rhodobacterales bacterium]